MSYSALGADRRSHASVLRAGQVLAGRYRVGSFLGAGSLGEVHEARDLELGERLAIKVLRPELAVNEQVLSRFKREIQLARRVTHPNVCRTFDLVYHRDRAPKADLVFLTMELLPGETLARRLARRGRISPEEALPIARQIAEALAAAHRAGVVHRDLKSANIVLVPGPRRERAVVADFGLAWSQILAHGSTATLTASGQLVGSPAYMAPEQVRGEEVGPATDVYAFGVVLYEMLTGELPFTGESAFYTALKRLQEPAPSPRSKVPELEHSWETAILRCLDEDPEARFQNPKDVVRSLGKDQRPAPEAAATRSRPRAWRRTLRHLAAMLVLLISAGWVLPGEQVPKALDDSWVEQSPVEVRPTVAVLGFENLSGGPDVDYVATSLLHMLPTELAATGELRLIPVGDAERATNELGLRRGARLSSASLDRLRRRTAADLVISGSYLVAAGNGGDRPTRFDLVIQDTRTREAVAALSLEGTEGGFLSTLSRLGGRLRAELGTGELPPRVSVAVRASRPSSLEAARLYSEGLAALRRFEAAEARRALERAAAVEPENPLIHGALASAWLRLGYHEKARLAAAAAVEHSGALRHEDRRRIEARYLELTHEWDGAVAVYRELFDYFPDDLEHGLRLAAAQTSGGAAEAARATVARLRRLPAPAGNDPRIDLAEARAAGALGEFERQSTAARRAGAAAGQLTARQLVARAELEQASALQGQGDNAGAAATLERAQQLFAEARDPKGVADALKQLGTLKKRQGELGTARELYRESLATYRHLGDRRGEGAVLSNLAIIHGKERNLDAAVDLYEQALAIMREIDFRRGEAVVLLNLGGVATWQGDLARTAELSEQALVTLRQIGDRFSEATTLHNLGVVRWKQGDLAAATEQLEAARDLQQQLGSENYLAASTHHDLADVYRARGEPDLARRGYRRALALRRQLGERARAAESLAGLAALAFQEGQLSRSAELIDEALAEPGLSELPVVEARVYRTLADSLLARGRLREARTAIEHSRSRAAAADDAWLELPTAISAARIAAAAGDGEHEIAELRTAVERARRSGFAGRLLEARLLLGEIEIDAGEADGGRQILGEVVERARARGFARIARRAEAAIS
ncbi:MAG: protein kinase [bacterium]|nr:protein kinase [bacterium]